ncbi:MAG: phosphatase PAP2 family protein [Salibacteraceae bacterium]
MGARLAKLLRAQGWFLGATLLFVLTGILLLQLMGRDPLFMAINGWHTPWADPVFQYTTWLGDGVFFAVVVVLLGFYRFGFALLAGLSFGLSSLLAQLLKKLVFSDALRPKGYFDDLSVVHFVEGVSVHARNAFPSGHTTTAFSVFLVLAIFLNKPKAGVLLAVLAMLAGWSRIYLGQHFPEDVVAGASLGTLTTLLVFSTLNPETWGKWTRLSFRTLKQKSR